MRLKKDLILLGIAFFIFALILVKSPKNLTVVGTVSDAYENMHLDELLHHHGDEEHDRRHAQHHHHDKEQDKHAVYQSGANMFSYWPPPLADTTRPGKKFDVDIRMAKQIKQMSKHLFVLNDQTVDKFVFVMAASTNHFNESLDGVASVQHHFPGKKLFYYDLGLRNHQVHTIQSWKWVEYRKFDFNKYPKYFLDNLRMVGWKPIIIQEVMAEYGAVFWMDASIRVITSDFSVIYDQVEQNGGIVLFKNTKHSNFAATHKGTYDYIPTNRTKQLRTPMCIATAILAYNTKPIFYNVLWWFFLCALQEKCQAPMEKTMCDFNMENKWGTFANCHKWDQSSLNILLSNYYGYKHHKYLAEEEVVAVERWPTNRYHVQVKAPEE